MVFSRRHFVPNPVSLSTPVFSPQCKPPRFLHTRYDDNGNRTNNGYTVGANNRLTSDGTYTYTYDTKGNREARFIDNDSSGTLNTGDTDLTQYSWDQWNRLEQVVNDAVYGGSSTKCVRFFYDHNNRLIYREVDPDGHSGSAEHQYTVFVYDGNQILLHFEKSGGTIAAGDLKHRYLWGPQVDQILADEYYGLGIGGGSSAGGGITRRVAGGGISRSKPASTNPIVLWPLGDHLHSVRDLAIYDSSLDTTIISKHRVYDAFGKLIADTGSSIPHLFHYTARPLDTSTSLQNNLNRWYDSAVGRWLSEDPVVFDAGDVNLNRYCDNCPAISTDPLGLITDEQAACRAEYDASGRLRRLYRICTVADINKDNEGFDSGAITVQETYSDIYKRWREHRDLWLREADRRYRKCLDECEELGKVDPCAEVGCTIGCWIGFKAFKANIMLAWGFEVNALRLTELALYQALSDKYPCHGKNVGDKVPCR